MIVVFRGDKNLASFISFFEIAIWLVTAGQGFSSLNQWHLSLAYASGFTVGNYMGNYAGNYVSISIESRFSIGTELIRYISFNRDTLAEKSLKRDIRLFHSMGTRGKHTPLNGCSLLKKGVRLH
jgi:uncharacterized protein YebE (UPF0316 family)